MPFASINSTNPRTTPWKFHEKILRIGGAGKWGFFQAAILNFLSRPFWFFFASYQWKTQPIYMRFHFFLHYGWFFQNLGIEAVRTFMHTTVPGTFLNIKVAFPTVWDFFLLSNCFTQFKIQSFEMYWFLTQESCFQCNLNVEKATSSFNSIFLINLWLKLFRNIDKTYGLVQFI